MQPDEFLERAGLREAPRDDRFAWRILLIACLLYALGFACFYPAAISNDDESGYLRQTTLALQGTASISKVNAFTGETERYYPSTYPCGTALAMALPVALAGWRGAYVVPCLSLLASVLLLGRWLQQERRSPLFALLLLGYPPNLVLGRVAMSDVPSMFLVILGLWLFWRGSGRGAGWWLASGFVAGGSFLFRESNPIPFAPFFAGTLVRRERRVWALVVGGIAGLALRIAANRFFFQDAMHYRVPYILQLGAVPERLPMYLLALLVFVPGGLVLALLYRGHRAAELRIAIVGFVVAYLIQSNYTTTTSLLKNMVVTPRYLIPLVPLIVFGMAESVPRLWWQCLERVDVARRDGLRDAGRAFVAVWIAGVLVASFAVHPAFAIWSTTQGEIRDAIAGAIDPDQVILTNFMATRKFLPELDMKYLAIDRARIDVETANSLVERYGEAYIVFLDRGDSAHWVRDARENAEFLRDIRPAPELAYDRQFTATFTPADHLRVWRVRRDGDSRSAAEAPVDR